MYREMIIDLLNCTELNLEDMEPETLETISEAHMLLQLEAGDLEDGQA
jgi:hypothetical protein